MRKNTRKSTGLALFAALALSLIAAGPVFAETRTSIDAGRGDVPLFVPDSYSAEQESPLIVLLHGYASSGSRQEDYMKFSALVDRYGFLYATPDGTEETEGNHRRFWNASSACCNFYRAALDDSAYVMNIIRQVQAAYRIDPRRIYLIGHSNGGFMSYRMAYEHGDVIAGIASLAGAEASEARPAPAHPVHVLQIHGTADETIAYAGGDIQGNAYPGALETIGRWATNNGCAAQGQIIGTLDLERNLEGLETTRTRYAQGCRIGGSAELWTIADGGHIPVISDAFSQAVVEWLLARQKP
ncbi:MAG: alpha/beta hydrolase fold domain-containing protein [Pseudomonadales bacterium]|nr:alpha/beta hydrolase fold domain-containing protein [Pseudomonadales bacterium]